MIPNIRGPAERILKELDWLSTRPVDDFNRIAFIGEIKIALHIAALGGISPHEADAINHAIDKVFAQFAFEGV